MEPMDSRDDTIVAAIRAQTVVAQPPLVPELRLHLVTPECRLWRASESEAAELGFRDPFWAFCWAGGQALARYVLDHRAEFAGRRALDLGSGCGVVAIAAAMAGAEVLAADIDPWAIAATEINAELNGTTLRTTAADLIGRQGPWDVVLAGDMTYEAPLAARVLTWFETLSEGRADVFFGDPNRGYANARKARAVATYDAPADNDPGRTFFVRTVVYAL